MKTAVTVFIAAMVFSGLALPTGVNAENPCHNLELSIPGGYHIALVNCTKGSAVTWGNTWATFRQDRLHGPQCAVTVRADNWSALAFFHVHQDFCFFKSGDITVTDDGSTDSRPVYTITKGHFEISPGKINITAFERVR